MISAPIPDCEASRLATLQSYKILDTAPDEGFYDIVDAVRTCLDVPMAFVSLVDADRQWFKAHRGLSLFETPRDVSFCGHAIMGASPFVIPDTLKDERFCDNPLVVSDPYIRFYIGVPLIVPGGEAIGTLCAFDTTPRAESHHDVSIMRLLARQTVRLLELHKMSVERFEARQRTFSKLASA
jgi:GAF domain-containing protein